MVHFGRRSSGSVSVSSGVAHRGVCWGGGERELDGRGGERGWQCGGVVCGGRSRERVGCERVVVRVVDVSSREVSVVGVDRLEAYGGEEVRVTGGAIGVESLGRLDGVAAGGVSLTTEDAVVRAPGARRRTWGAVWWVCRRRWLCTRARRWV